MRCYGEEHERAAIRLRRSLVAASARAVGFRNAEHYLPRIELRDPEVMSGTTPDLNMETILTQLARAREETQKFIAEQHKLMAEQQKLNFEALKVQRERGILPWQVAATMLGAGAALFAAGAGFIKLIPG